MLHNVTFLCLEEEYMHLLHKFSKRNIKIFSILFLIFILIVACFLVKDSITNTSSKQVESPTKVICDTDKDPETIIKEYAAEHGYSVEDYPEKLITLMKKEPKSQQFVLDYPEKAGKKSKVRLGKIDYDQVPLFIQWDTRWGYAPYGNGIVGLDGCGPTCLSMAAVYFLHDKSMTPDYIASFSAENGYYKDGVGTMWSLFNEGAEKLGLKATELPLEKKDMLDALDDGKIIICSVGPGDFTEKGHFILLTGYGDDGFYVNDPNSYNNSEKLWSYSKLSPQIKNLWAVSRK